MPRLVLSRSAWSSVVRWSAESDVEQWGFLLGKRLSTNIMISRATRFDGGARTAKRIEINVAAAREAEDILREKYPATPPVGAWHSHPWGDDVLNAMAIQVSNQDKQIVPDGIAEVVVAVHDDVLNPDRFRSRDDLLVRRWRGSACRVEAWIRMGRRFLPLDIEAR